MPSLLLHPLRTAGRSLWLLVELVCTAAGYLFRIVLRPVPDLGEARALWLQCHARRILRVFNVQWAVRGAVPDQGLLACNHLSYLDVLVLAAITPAVFVAKREVRAWPVFGWFARMAGTVFVARERRGGTPQTSNEIRHAIVQGRLVVLFPEGTTSNGQEVLPFKTALFDSAKDTARVWAAGIGYEMEDGNVVKDVCYWGDMTLIPHMINLAAKRGVQARLAFSRVSNLSSDRKQLARELRSEVIRLREALSADTAAPRESISDVRIRSPGSTECESL